MENIILIITLSLPLIISGIVHMMIVRFNLFPEFALPINAKLFGQNKTWRGMIFIPITTALGALITQQVAGPLIFTSTKQAWGIGLLLGLAYALGELPNSYFKRKQGIAPGQLGKSNQLTQVIIDQADSVIPVLCVYYAFIDWVDLVTCLQTFAAGVFLHLFINLSLYFVGLRKSPI